MTTRINQMKLIVSGGRIGKERLCSSLKKAMHQVPEVRCICMSAVHQNNNHFSRSRTILQLMRNTSRNQDQFLPCLLTTRLSSTFSEDDKNHYVPEPPSVSPPAQDLVTNDSLSVFKDDTLASVGLGGWSPPGIVQQCLELIHVNIGVPWWASIVICTITVRILMFPLVIKSQQNVAKLHNRMPVMGKLQKRFTDSRASGDPVQAAKAGHELMTYMQKNDIKPARNFMVPLAQMPVFLSVFFGLRQMSNLPVESLKDGGVLWFVDLTSTDPTYGLPLLTVLTLAATTELGVDGVKAQSMGHVIKWVFRGLPLIIFPVICNFPCAMLCYWFTSNAFSLVQVAFLKVPSIRSFFKIEKMVHVHQSSLPKKKFLEGFKESWNNAKITQVMEERQVIDSKKFKEAGRGPIQKTFSLDPTKRKSSKL